MAVTFHEKTIPSGMQFFIIDALKGYHQAPLDEASTDLTRFPPHLNAISICGSPSE